MAKRLIIWLLALPTVVLCCLIVFRIITKRPPDIRSLQEIRFQYASNQMVVWNANADFEEIKNAEDFKIDLQRLLRIKTDIQITTEQDSSLKDSIYDFLMAYHDGDYVVYKTFRMPAAGEIDSQHLDKLRTFMSKNGNQSLASLSALPQDELFKIFVSLRSKGTFYKDFFVSVSFQKSQVEVSEYHEIPQDLKTFVFNDTTNLGVASFEPMFTFDRRPAKILKEDGVLICATAVLYIKTKEPSAENMPAPIYLRLVWDSQSRKWLPSELAVGNIWQKSKIIIAF